MAEDQKQLEYGETQRQVSGTTVLYSSLAGVAVGGPLLVMMGFSFLATVTLLLVTSPLLISFSPLLFFAAFVLVSIMAGFATTAATALVGISSFVWIFRSFRGIRACLGFDEDKLESGEMVVEQGEDFAGYLEQMVQDQHEKGK
ncbi:oleosin Ara h 10.0101-like [Cornus florida]|uniref:oleosin Ara h 10.0101-like n=1 Tax=Cornus florida TaxID=4283 RepID=UPI00289CF199|nr:oleosin Ara h 10.0101-like [Cornus florida]